jgi:hypothetical protein
MSAALPLTLFCSLMSFGGTGFNTDSKKHVAGPECLKLAQELGRDKVPASCEKYLKIVDEQNIAWQGAPFTDRVSGTKSAEKGQPQYYVLQRRFTDHNVPNPYAKTVTPEKDEVGHRG